MAVLAVSRLAYAVTGAVTTRSAELNQVNHEMFVQKPAPICWQNGDSFAVGAGCRRGAVGLKRHFERIPREPTSVDDFAGKETG